jgi:hypothetical protein
MMVVVHLKRLKPDMLIVLSRKNKMVGCSLKKMTIVDSWSVH